MATARLSMPVRLENSAACWIGQELLDVLLVLLGIESNDVFLDPAEHPEFRLDDHAGRMSEFHRPGGRVDVFFHRVMAAHRS